MCFSINFVKFRKNIEGFVETQNSWFTAEMGTFIYAMVNCILMGLASVISVLWLTGHVFWYFILGYSHSGTLLTDLLMTALAGGTLVISIVSFSFGVVLLRGMLMKRPFFIKAYFIYGVAVVSVCVITAVTLSSKAREFDVYVVCSLILIGACVIYSVILGVIWMAYRNLQSENYHSHRSFHHNLTSSL